MAKGVGGEGALGVRRSITQPDLELLGSLLDGMEAEESVQRWAGGGYVKKIVKRKLWAEEGARATWTETRGLETAECVLKVTGAFEQLRPEM